MVLLIYEWFCSRRLGLSIVAILTVGATCYGCSNKDAKNLNKCLLAEGRLKEDKATCQSVEQQLSAEIQKNQEQLDACAANKEFLTKSIAAAEAELSKLKQTPSYISREIIESIETIKTVAELDSLLDRINQFRKRFPNADERKVLADKIPLIQKMKPKLLAEEALAKQAALVSEFRGILSSASDTDTEPVSEEQRRLAIVLSSKGIKYDEIIKMPRTNRMAIYKEGPINERGKAVIIQGEVQELKRVVGGYAGVMEDSKSDQRYYFFTPGSTNGIHGSYTGGSRAKFAGIFAHEFIEKVFFGKVDLSHQAIVGYFKDQN